MINLHRFVFFLVLICLNFKILIYAQSLKKNYHFQNYNYSKTFAENITENFINKPDDFYGYNNYKLVDNPLYSSYSYSFFFINAPIILNLSSTARFSSFLLILPIAALSTYLLMDGIYNKNSSILSSVTNSLTDKVNKTLNYDNPSTNLNQNFKHSFPIIIDQKNKDNEQYIDFLEPKNIDDHYEPDYALNQIKNHLTSKSFEYQQLIEYLSLDIDSLSTVLSFDDHAGGFAKADLNVQINDIYEHALDCFDILFSNFAIYLQSSVNFAKFNDINNMHIKFNQILYQFHNYFLNSINAVIDHEKISGFLENYIKFHNLVIKLFDLVKYDNYLAFIAHAKQIFLFSSETLAK